MVPLAILTWLVLDVQRKDPETFQQLRLRPKHWGLLSAALCVALAAHVCTFVRWYLLVRALRIPFRLRDAFRLGFLGCLFNFISLGSVGGDLFKAIFIARQQKRRRAEAVATVLVDRLIGLLALVVVTSLAVSFVPQLQATPELRVIAWCAYGLTAAGAVCVALLLLPGFTQGSLAEKLIGLPRIGRSLERVIAAVRLYRGHKAALVAIAFLSLSVHVLLAVAIYATARGLFPQTATFGEHLLIAPLSSLAGALPVAPAGLGTFEFAMDFLYDRIPAAQAGSGQGLVVALCYRAMLIAIAGVGVVYYWADRRAVRQLWHEAEIEAERMRHADAGSAAVDASGPFREARIEPLPAKS